ncbi:hypothetical protein LB507_007046, partial [Fusarium sp. FIESC RH6]
SAPRVFSSNSNYCICIGPWLPTREGGRLDNRPTRPISSWLAVRIQFSYTYDELYLAWGPGAKIHPLLNKPGLLYRPCFPLQSSDWMPRPRCDAASSIWADGSGRNGSFE